MSKYLSPANSFHQTAAVVAVVTGFSYVGETTEELKDLQDSLKDLFENYVGEISNLHTGHYRHVMQDKTVSIRAAQADFHPCFAFKELRGRTIQALLRRWIRADLGVNLLIYEVRAKTGVEQNGDGLVTYAWRFKDLRPDSTGVDLVEGSRQMSISFTEISYTVSLHGQFEDNLDDALVTAIAYEATRTTESIKEVVIVEPKLDTSNPAPARLDGERRQEPVNGGQNLQRRQSDQTPSSKGPGGRKNR